MPDLAMSALHTPGAAIVGRDRELAALRAALAAALAGQGSLALIGGEAGIGKTALAEVVLAEARQQDMLILVGRCHELTETPPYGPWLDLFARYQHRDLLAPPGSFAQRGALGAVVSQADVIDQCMAFVRALASMRPLVLLLEDLHWADPASLDLLRALAREAATLPLLLMVTYRPDEAAGQRPLHASLPVLVREARPVRLELPPLSLEATTTLVVGRYALPEAESWRLARYLVRRSDGNPFFLGELLRDLEEGGELVVTASGWRLADLQTARVPALIRQVIANRLARCSVDDRTALAQAAVIGQEVPLARWATLADVTEETLLPCIERAVAAHLLVASEDGAAVRFYHALTWEAVYASVLPPRRRAWHRAIAEALMELPAPPPEAVAHHFERAADARAVSWLTRAGARAQAAYAYLTAAERYEAALRLMTEGTATSGERGWLTLRIAWLRFYQEPTRSAERADEVLRLAAEANDAELAACARFSAGHFRVTAGEFRTGLRDIRAGVAALDALPDGEQTWRVAQRTLELPLLAPFQPHGVLVASLAYAGHLLEARDVGRASVASPTPTPGEEEDGDRVGDMQAHLGLGIAYAGLGDPEQSRRAFAQARASLRATSEHLLTSVVDLYEFTFAVLPYQADDLAERCRLITATGAAWAKGTGAYADEHLARLAGLLLHILEGRWDEVHTLVRSGTLPPPIRFFQRAALGVLARERGDAERAWQLVREALPAGPATMPGDGPLITLLACQRLAADLALDAGDRPAARAWLEAHDRFLHWSGSVPGRAEAHLGWAAYHHAVGDLPRAIRHAADACALAGTPRQPLVLLVARRTLGAFLTAAGRHTDARPHLTEALALADACAAPYERARCLLTLAEWHAAVREYAQAHVLLGEAVGLLDPLAARPALDRAAALAARLASAPTRPVAGSAAFPGGLSDREVEVLRLVALGLTDAQVAARLAISRRTVSTHLTNIYTKLGVATRTAAARVAAEHGLG